MLRFVVLHHTGWPGHPSHYDLMLQTSLGENDNSPVLKTFATREDCFPESGAQLKAIADHRRAYLALEGPLSKNRGRVSRVEEGALDAFAVSASGDIEFTLDGSKLRGRFRLRCEAGSVFTFEKIG